MLKSKKELVAAGFQFSVGGFAQHLFERSYPDAKGEFAFGPEEISYDGAGFPDSNYKVFQKIGRFWKLRTTVGVSA